MSEGRSELLGVTLLVDGEETIVRVGDATVKVPTTSVSLGGGRLFIEVEGDLAATFRREHVAVTARFAEPSPEHLHALVSSLDPQLVTALMGEESAISSLADPIGLIAMRAVARALRGETPPLGPDPMQTLG